MTFRSLKHADKILEKIVRLLITLAFFPALFLFPAMGYGEDIQSFQKHGVQFLAPKGRWAVRMEVRVNDYKTWYDASGNKEDLDADLDGLELNNTIFTLPPSVVSLGTANIDTQVDVIYGELTVGYGITDNLTVGMILPYGRTRTKIDFSVSGGNTDLVKNLLSDPAFGFGYNAIQNQEVSGIGDPILGLLWRFHQDGAASMIYGFGVRLGLAEKDDPDNLLDVPVSDGSTDIKNRIEYYRSLGHHFDLRLLAESTLQLPDKARLRVAKAGELLPPASSKEKLSRDLGDFWEFDIEMGYSLGSWRTSATWHRYDKGSDRYKSSKGSDTSELEKDSSQLADQWRLSLSWSGIEAWQNGKLPLPLIVSIERQETFAGKNFPDITDTYLRFTSFF